MVQGAISPERVDYFADGKYKNEFCFPFAFPHSFHRKENLKT